MKTVRKTEYTNELNGANTAQIGRHMSPSKTRSLRAGLFVMTLVLMRLGAFPQENQDKKVQSSTPDKTAGDQRAAERTFPSASDATFTPVELQPISTPISLNLEGDAKMIYETIGKMVGLTVIFDSDYVSRPIRISLQRVPLQEALQAAALESKTFWRPVTPNTILVAPDTVTKRRDFEQSVIKVFSIAGSTAADAQDIANSMRVILDISRVQPLAPGVVAVRGTPEQIKLAGKLIDDINKARPKLNRYRVEIKIAEVDGKTKLNSRTYSLFLQRNQEQRLNIVPGLPAVYNNQAGTDKDKPNLQPMDYQNIDCNITSESEHEVTLTLRGTFSDFSGVGSANQSGGGRDVRQFSIDARPTLTLDKPTIINSFDDPATRHTVQVELTVTRLSGT